MPTSRLYYVETVETKSDVSLRIGCIERSRIKSIKEQTPGECNIFAGRLRFETIPVKPSPVIIWSGKGRDGIIKCRREDSNLHGS